MSKHTRKLEPNTKTSPKGQWTVVEIDLLQYLYQQLPLVIVAEFLIALLVAAVLSPITPPMVIYLWLGYLLIFSTTSHVVLYAYNKYYPQALSHTSWMNLFRFMTFLSAAFWGFFAGYFIPESNVFYDRFVVFVLLGVTASSLVFYSANRLAYAIFFLVSFVPAIVRIYSYGGLYYFLSVAAIIYTIVMLMLSNNIYHLIKNALLLRFENRDLDSINQNLEKNILFQANHDTLTLLPNRILLRDRIEHDIAIANRFKSYLAVMLIDLDHFKDIDDLIGYQKGDSLLKIVASRLQSCIRESDTLARFGGDEFIILFICKKTDELTELCKDILNAITLPIRIGAEEFHITASIGISIYPNDGNDGTTLIRNADLAMYLAKKNGRNRYQVYSDIVNSQIKRQHEIQQQLLSIPEKNEFNLKYQPVINIETKEIISAEALLRWNNPVLGLVSPEEFIAIAEDIGAFESISEWVIHQACKQNMRWRAAGAPPIKIAINISSVQLRRGNLTKILHKVLHELGMDPRCLILELTETSLMDNSQSVIDSLKEIRSLGMEISIDDFGAGYSSFRYLTEFPVTRLKMDKSLVHSCEVNSNNIAIIEAIVTMAHHLNLKVTAEGVENELQLAAVQSAGCDEIQGFYYSKPLESNDFLAFLMKNSFVAK